MGYRHLNLGLLRSRQGRYEEGVAHSRQALEIFEVAFGPEHVLVGNALYQLGNLYRYQQQYAEAEPLYRRSLAVYRESLPPDHPYLQNLAIQLAELLRATGREAEAAALETEFPLEDDSERDS